MTPGESSSTPGDDAHVAGQTPTFDEGRYIYCIVLVDEDGVDEGDGAATEDATALEFEPTGVEGEPVSLVTVDGLGAVVHTCEEIYDSADIGRIRRWLVRHQSVVDDAGEAFGTPLPFQFDTILRGDDEAVREWLRSEYDTLRPILESLAGHWEYRVEVVRQNPVGDEELEASDEQLSQIRTQIDESDEGAAFLLEKRYERRAKEVRAHRREVTTADLVDRLSAHAREVHELERSPAATLEGGGDETGTESETPTETICRLTLLAHEDEEEAVGSVLDDVASEPGVEVRFTGPWPPYTFAPELGGGDDAESVTTGDTESDRR